jgi:hypothetical protein
VEGVSLGIKESYYSSPKPFPFFAGRFYLGFTQCGNESVHIVNSSHPRYRAFSGRIGAIPVVGFDLLSLASQSMRNFKPYRVYMPTMFLNYAEPPLFGFQDIP